MSLPFAAVNTGRVLIGLALAVVAFYVVPFVIFPMFARRKRNGLRDGSGGE
jgi:hypothetical protein